MSRFLITTADERTWKFDRPVLFLGEWCRYYDRRHVWERMDAVVAEPYGIDPGDKRRDLARTEAATRDLLVELASALNLVHGTAHDGRYWQIVLGHWLRRYVDIVFNRHATIERALAAHHVDGTAVIDAPGSTLVRNDSLSFIYGCNHDLWNHVLFARLLDLLEPAGMAREQVVPGLVPDVDAGLTAGVATPFWKQAAVGLRGAILAACRRDRDALIIQSYLPRRTEVTLQLSLGQCPQFWRTPAAELTAPSPEWRQRLSLSHEGRVGFDRCVRALLPELLPACYLEGYSGLERQARSLPWPSRPQFIFTSNNFDTDEVFKVWCAGQVERHTPYFAGQHGNNYGTHFYAGNDQWPERAATDAFISWGWSAPNVVAAFNFKAPAPEPLRHDAAGGLLLVEECLNHRLTPWDSYYEFGTYQEQQFRFVAALPEEIRAALTVRLHGDHLVHRWSEPQRWADRQPGTSIETGRASIRTLIAQNRLVVYSYESTGVLENLTSNVPTVCFWPGGLAHLMPEASGHYERLIEAGVIAESPQHAATLVTRYWDDIGAWWGSAVVQQARAAFCQHYARAEPRPAKAMRRLLTEQAARVTSAARVSITTDPHPVEGEDR